MSALLFLKIETTGLPRKGAKPTDLDLPRLMHISAILQDKARRDVGSVELRIRPDGWIVRKGAEGKHGLTQSDCEAFGVRPRAAIGTLMDLVRSAGEIVAFNIQFVDLVLEGEMQRLGGAPVEWRRSGLKRTCLMRDASQFLNGGRPISFVDACSKVLSLGRYPDHDFGLQGVERLSDLHHEIAFKRSTL